MDERVNGGVVVDAGHGGSDPGAISGNLKEKDFTLEAALYMYAFAQGDTAHVVIRPSNVDRCMEILNKLNCNVLTKNSL